MQKKQLELWQTHEQCPSPADLDHRCDDSQTLHDAIDAWLDRHDGSYNRSKVDAAYQWPASRLAYDDVRRLTIVSNHVKRPINQLIKEAVDLYATVMLQQIDNQKK